MGKPAPPRLSPALAQAALDAYAQYDDAAVAARSLGLARTTFQTRLQIARSYGLTPGGTPPAPEPPPPAHTPLAGDNRPATDVLQQQLRRGPCDVQELASRCRITPGQALDSLLAMKARGVNLHVAGAIWSLSKEPEAGTVEGVGAYLTKADGTFCCGAIGDTHLGSKYARLDILTDLYRRFEEAGVDRVFHSGNWIDGEKDGVNKYDLLVHGMDNQINYLAQEYPSVKGITTYAVAGNDHEGWYGQREGIDIGKHCQSLMREAGRTDWVHLGHMEAFIPIRHAGTGAQSMLHVMHPGGGSAYAVSYTVQKIVEGYEGGEKPAILFAGHYHKMAYLRTRNVRTLQTGCTQDLTPWARGKKLRYELGGWIVRGRVDAESGALVSVNFEDFGYFNKGFYTNRWSHGGDVTLPDRDIA